MSRFAVASVVVFVCCQSVLGQSAVYSPYSSWQSPHSLWDSKRISLEASARQQSGRPVLPGLRPVSVELLQDALLRKRPNLRNDSAKARQKIVEQYLGKGSKESRIGGRSSLYGDMAEATFLQKNPEWKYVSKPNASQHDVYRTMIGKRPPLNGQVKLHINGKPSAYARDMQKDFRAHRFFIPDDHVQPVRDYWLRKYEAAKRSGDAVSAKQAARNAGRVQPIGATSKQIVTNTNQTVQYSLAESRNVYVSLAAGVALSLGQIGWDFAHGALSTDQAAYRTTKALSLIGTGVIADTTLRMIRDGAFRGTLRGNLLVGGVVLVAETSWSVYENGGLAAFRQPEFYEQLGGSVTAIGIGGVAAFYSGLAATAAASEFGPAAPFIGGGTALLVGTGAGMVAYIGGRSTTSWLIHNFWPELYQQYEREQIVAAKKQISRSIESAKTLK